MDTKINFSGDFSGNLKVDARRAFSPPQRICKEVMVKALSSNE
jgi:hypothetical protein